MATGRCQSCNADLPRGARFCARCGVGVDSIPVLDLSEGAVGETPLLGDDVPPSRTRIARTLVILVLVGVVVMLILSALADGSDEVDDSSDEGRGEEGTTTSTSVPRTSTSLADAAIAGGELMGDAFGLVVVLADEDELTVFDPATGARHVAPLPFGNTPLLTATADGLVAHVPGADELRLLAGDGAWNLLAGIPGWRPIYIDARGVVQLSGLDAGGVWSRSALGFVSDGVQVVLSDSDLSIVQGFGPVGEVDGALVVGTVDGVFRIGAGGSAQRIASGQPLAMSDATLMVLSCSDQMRCGHDTVDLASGETHRLPEVPGAVMTASVSPDGSQLIVATDGASSGGVEVFALIGDRWVPAAIDGGWQLGSAVWADGGLMWWDPDGRQLVAVRIEGDDVATQVLPLDVEVDSAVVMPRAQLPAAWRTALDAG